MPDHENLTLTNLGNGGALELFQTELDRVLENILDPNTEAKAKRVITLKVTFVPSSDRNEVGTDVACESKLAPMLGTNATVYVGRDRDSGLPRAVCFNPKQGNLFDDPKKPHPIRETEENAATA